MSFKAFNMDTWSFWVQPLVVAVRTACFFTQKLPVISNKRSQLWSINVRKRVHLSVLLTDFLLFDLKFYCQTFKRGVKSRLSDSQILQHNNTAVCKTYSTRPPPSKQHSLLIPALLLHESPHITGNSYITRCHGERIRRGEAQGGGEPKEPERTEMKASRESSRSFKETRHWF